MKLGKLNPDIRSRVVAGALTLGVISFLVWVCWRAAWDTLPASPTYVAAATSRVSAPPQTFRLAASKEFRQCLEATIRLNRGAADHSQVNRCVARARTTALALEQKSASGVR